MGIGIYGNRRNPILTPFSDIVTLDVVYSVPLTTIKSVSGAGVLRIAKVLCSGGTESNLQLKITVDDTLVHFGSGTHGVLTPDACYVSGISNIADLVTYPYTSGSNKNIVFGDPIAFINSLLIQYEVINTEWVTAKILMAGAVYL